MGVRFKVGGPAHEVALPPRPPRAVGYIHNTPPNGLEWASNGPKWSATGLGGLPNGLEMSLSNWETGYIRATRKKTKKICVVCNSYQNVCFIYLP